MAGEMDKFAGVVDFGLVIGTLMFFFFFFETSDLA